ncbi:monocarboxylate transporter 9b [Hypomesus transpacificus]|uniref:monocarboxylate transporter 9b n=1 Tax=Hypomesus transpacificus TaxID=137520 RepID=UPI001F07FCD0|nr:monocarboxylate transporter 9b [Hypomesus transpacificus]
MGSPQGSNNIRKPLDGGWGWAIVVACFLAQLLAYGSPQSVGVIYPEWLSAFQESKAMTAWVGSLVSGVGLIASPICSACVVNFGARPVTIFSGVMVSGGLMLSAFAPNIPFLIFSYGLVVGLGCGLVYAATLTITCQYFDKRRGLALGIVTTGTSVGGFLYATAQNELIELFGLEGCLLIIGALALNIIACAGPMRPLVLPAYYLRQRAAALEQVEGHLYDKAPLAEEPIKPANEKQPQACHMLITIETKDPLAYEKTLLSCSALVKLIKTKQKDYCRYICSISELLQDRVFMALCVSLFLYALGAYPPLLFMEDVAQTRGLVETVSVIPLVSITAICAGVGKLALGAMADLPFVNSVLLYAFTLTGSGSALLLIPVTRSYAGLQVLSAALGFFSGNWSLTPYVTTEVVGIERFTQAHGILMLFGGFGIMLGSPVVGFLYDWTQSYDLAFYLSGGGVLLGGLCLFLSSLPCLDRPKPQPPQPQPDLLQPPEVLRPEPPHPDPEYPSTCDMVASVA